MASNFNSIPFADPLSSTGFSYLNSSTSTSPSFWSNMGSTLNGWGTSWGGINTVNAAVTGILSAFSTISGVITAGEVYDYYKQQEQMYLENARIQARRAQIKGDIALTNLEVKHALAKGDRELAVAGAGGRLSGSFLDVLTQNNKYALMEERTQSLETLWQVDNIIRGGYISAYQSAAQSRSYALQNRANALAGLASFAKNMASGLLADKRQNDTLDAMRKIQVDSNRDLQMSLLKIQYGDNALNSTSGAVMEINNMDTSISEGDTLGAGLSLEEKVNQGILPSMSDMDYGYKKYGNDINKWSILQSAIDSHINS